MTDKEILQKNTKKAEAKNSDSNSAQPVSEKAIPKSEENKIKENNKAAEQEKKSAVTPIPSAAPLGKNGQPAKKPRKTSIMEQLLWLVITMLAVGAIWSYVASGTNNKDIEEITLSGLAGDIRGGLVEEIEVKGDRIDITYIEKDAETGEGITKFTTKERDASLSETLVNYRVDLSAESIPLIKESEPNKGALYWLNILSYLAPFLLVGVIIWFMMRARGGGMQAFSFGQSKHKAIDPNDPNRKIRFEDVAGAEEPKKELLEIVEFLKEPKKFIEIGAKIPKGALLMGPPGTGKTLLARAVAGEAGVPFFSISGSEFVEMFVGVGAARVRDLFAQAKKQAPAIIFVDEIDSVGRMRGSGFGGGNDEREQTLNQILVEMDGFEPTQKVIVIAATNRPDVLDPALLRPGRFDRRIKIDLPDRTEREAILKVHSRKKPLEKEVDLSVVAGRTPGFSGADLESLLNEAAIAAAREDRKMVSQDDILQSIEKVILGPARSNHLLSKEERKLTAYHEAGHALVASVLPHADPVQKISIISRGHAAGYVLNLPLDEKKMRTREMFIDKIAVALGGYITEKNVYGDVSTGPSSDLQNATALAREMVTRYGMSPEIGPIALENDGGDVMYGAASKRDYSERMSAQVDKEVSKIIDDAYKRANKALVENRKLLDALVKKLLDSETMEREEFEQFMSGHGIAPKKSKMR